MAVRVSSSPPWQRPCHLARNPRDGEIIHACDSWGLASRMSLHGGGGGFLISSFGSLSKAIPRSASLQLMEMIVGLSSKLEAQCVKGMLKISGFTCNGAEVIAL